MVAAAFGVFKPEVVSAGVTLGWSLTDAPTIFAERRAGAVAQLERVLGAADDGVARASVLLERAVEPLGVEGPRAVRGLAVVVGRSDRSVDAAVPPRRHAARVPRRRARVGVGERRRSTAVEIGLLNDLYMGMPFKSYVRTRGWNDDELDAGEERLRERGLARRRRTSATTAATRARTSSARPTGRWRPRSTRSATTSTSCSGCSQPWGAAIREAGGYVGGPVDLWPNRDD